MTEKETFWALTATFNCEQRMGKCVMVVSYFMLKVGECTVIGQKNPKS